MTGSVRGLKLTQFIDANQSNPIVASILEPMSDYYNGPDFLNLDFTAPNAGLFAYLKFFIPSSVFSTAPSRGFGYKGSITVPAMISKGSTALDRERYPVSVTIYCSGTGLQVFVLPCCKLSLTANTAYKLEFQVETY